MYTLGNIYTNTLAKDLYKDFDSSSPHIASYYNTPQKDQNTLFYKKGKRFTYYIILYVLMMLGANCKFYI